MFKTYNYIKKIDVKPFTKFGKKFAPWEDRTPDLGISHNL